MAPTVVIKFHSLANVFFPGQNISGIIEVTNDKQRKCEGLLMKFEGHAQVRFEETTRHSTSKGTETRTTTYIATEEYYKSKFLVWSDPSQQLQPGSFQFPFNFVLPLNAPASFQCRYGMVEHFCHASLQLPMARDSYCKRPYSVNSLLDLNMDPANRVAQVRQGVKTLCCLCCKSGPISAQVRLDKLGYVPGEVIHISAEVNNSSNRKVTATSAELFMNVQLIAVGRTRMENYKLVRMEKGEIAEGGDCIWSDGGIVIPPLPASGLLGCSIINISYNLKFTVSPQLPATSLTMDFPIIIGSIPLQETFQRFAPSESYQMPGPSIGFAQPQTGGAPQDPTQYMPPMFPGLQQYPSMPPPSYTQAVSSDGVGQGSTNPAFQGVAAIPGMSKDGFTPTYVSYNLKGNYQ